MIIDGVLLVDKAIKTRESSLRGEIEIGNLFAHHTLFIIEEERRNAGQALS